MAPDAHTPAPAGLTSCPHCRGAVRVDAPWCTQCWTDLRPAPAPVTPPPAVPAARHAGPLPLDEELPATASPADPSATEAAVRSAAGAGWPCTACGELNGLALDSCTTCGTPFLAPVRGDQEPLLVLPVVGDVLRLSRAQRLAMAALVALAVVLLVVLLSVLAG